MKIIIFIVCLMGVCYSPIELTRVILAWHRLYGVLYYQEGLLYELIFIWGGFILTFSLIGWYLFKRDGQS